MDAALLAILRCPETRQRLSPAPEELLASLEERRGSGKLRTRLGNVPETLVTAGLVREDGLVFFPIVDGIPILLMDEAIVLAQ